MNARIEKIKKHAVLKKTMITGERKHKRKLTVLKEKSEYKWTQEYKKNLLYVLEIFFIKVNTKKKL